MNPNNFQNHHQGVRVRVCARCNQSKPWRAFLRANAADASPGKLLNTCGICRGMTEREERTLMSWFPDAEGPVAAAARVYEGFFGAEGDHHGAVEPGPNVGVQGDAFAQVDAFLARLRAGPLVQLWAGLSYANNIKVGCVVIGGVVLAFVFFFLLSSINLSPPSSSHPRPEATTKATASLPIQVPRTPCVGPATPSAGVAFKDGGEGLGVTMCDFLYDDL